LETVKTLEKQYMAAQLAKAGTPGPKAIGIDEISIRGRQRRGDADPTLRIGRQS
jgi:hypothetical protein